MPREFLSSTLTDAQQIIAAGQRAAHKLGLPYDIAVLDAGGNLVAHARRDGAWVSSIDVSLGKAFKARLQDGRSEGQLGRVGPQGLW